MKIKIPQDLMILSKEQLMSLVRDLIAKMDNLESEVARIRELKPKCAECPCSSKCQCPCKCK